MKIRMKTTASGPEWSADAGSEVERPDAEAKALIKGGFADSIETATTTPSGVETAARVAPQPQIAKKG